MGVLKTSEHRSSPRQVVWVALGQQANLAQPKRPAHNGTTASPAGSEKSNDTARLSFSMDKSGGGDGEEEVTITGTGTNENDNDIESVLTSPSQ